MAAVAAWLAVGHRSGHSPATHVARSRTTRAVRRRAPVPRSPAARALGLPPVVRGPVPGYLLIADRNNNRLLLVSPDKRVVWRFPRPGDLRAGQSRRDPDE